MDLQYEQKVPGKTNGNESRANFTSPGQIDETDLNDGQKTPSIDDGAYLDANSTLHLFHFLQISYLFDSKAVGFGSILNANDMLPNSSSNFQFYLGG